MCDVSPNLSLYQPNSQTKIKCFLHAIEFQLTCDVVENCLAAVLAADTDNRENIFAENKSIYPTTKCDSTKSNERQWKKSRVDFTCARACYAECMAYTDKIILFSSFSMTFRSIGGYGGLDDCREVIVKLLLRKSHRIKFARVCPKVRIRIRKSMTNSILGSDTSKLRDVKRYFRIRYMRAARTLRRMRNKNRQHMHFALDNVLKLNLIFAVLFGGRLECTLIHAVSFTFQFGQVWFVVAGIR